MIKLSETAIQAIKDSTKLKGQIQVALDISSNTLYKRIKFNDVSLTSASSLEAIRSATGLDDAALLVRTT